MAVQPPSESAGARRACQKTFSPNMGDSIGNPQAPIARRARDCAKLNRKLILDIPDFISFSLRRRLSKSDNAQPALPQPNLTL
jgi:hypothetical protein